VLVIDFSSIGVIKEQPTLILCSVDDSAIGSLSAAYNLTGDICYNETSTISFELPAYIDGQRTPHYDDVIGMRTIKIPKYGRFVIVNPSTTNDGVKEIKTCKAYSLEYEFTYKQVYFEEGTYNFYDPFSPNDTVLGMLMEDFPSWSLGDVDSALIGKYRTFEETDSNAYNFIKSTLQESYECIFDFDTLNRKVNVRSTSAESTPTPVYLSLDNLIKELKIEEDTENIYTVLDVSGGEDVDIRMVNPLGTNKIYNLDYFMKPSHFESSMIEKWNSWKKSYENEQTPFYNISLERSLKTAAISTEESKLNELKSIDLAELTSERAVYIEYLAKLVDDDSDDYNAYQKKLKKVNSEIDDKNAEISEQEDVIASLKAEETALTEKLTEIKAGLAFDNFFTAEELKLLDRYFKEESIEETTFVVSEVDSYETSDISNSIKGISITFANCNFTETETDSETKMYSISGGSFSLTNTTTTLDAETVNATFEVKSDKTIILSAYLNKGKIGDSEFPNATISLTGDYSSVTLSGDGKTGHTSSVSVGGISGQMYFTRNTTDYEKHSVSWDLYEYGKSTLEKLAYPSYTFDVSSANFLSMDEFEGFIQHLKLGQKIYINTDNEILEPILIGVEIDFDDPTSLTLKFSDTYSASDNAFKLVDLLDQSISMGRTVESSKLNYSSFVNSGASNAVKDFMSSALDIAKNSILSSDGQGVSWDNAGLHLRKYIDKDDPDKGYEDEQISMINNSIVFTDDGWQTAKMAIGRIIDGNIGSYAETSDTEYNEKKTYYYIDVDENYQKWNGSEEKWEAEDRPLLYEKTGTAYGIVAPYIVGTILAGENCMIDTSNGSFKVDESGVYIDSLKFYITHGGTTYDTTLQDELDKLDLESTQIAGDIGDVVQNIDGLSNMTVAVYYQADEPETDNVGDLWFNTDTNRLYCYSGLMWRDTNNDGYAEKIKRGQDEQAGSDGVIMYYQQEAAPSEASAGDLWFNSSKSKTGKRNIAVGDRLEGKTLHFDTASKVGDITEDHAVITFGGKSGNPGGGIVVAKSTSSSIDNDYYLYVWTQGADNAVSIHKTFIYRVSGNKWIEDECGLETNYALVDYVNESSPFYSLISAEYTSIYEPQSLYRRVGSSWVLIDRTTTQELKDSISDVSKSLSNVITDNGYLNAEKLKGVISGNIAEMQSAKGNVLFDSDGIWLLNAATKREATKAIWMNEQGMQFGTGDACEDPANDDSWTWTTSVSHDGIEAEALAGKYLSGCTIFGGRLKIGDNFTVNTDGKMMAKNGRFEGTVQADKFEDSEGNSMMNGSKFKADYLSLYGLTIQNDDSETTFEIDTDGNVTAKGNIEATKVTANAEIQSPVIKGGRIWNTKGTTSLVLGTNDNSNYGDLTLYQHSKNFDSGRGSLVFQIHHEATSFSLWGQNGQFLSTGGGYTYATNTWDFTNATVKGLSAVATFG